MVKAEGGVAHWFLLIIFLTAAFVCRYREAALQSKIQLRQESWTRIS